MRQAIANAMFDFISKVGDAQTEAAVLSALEVTAHEFGLERFAISGIPLAHERIDPYFMLNRWPEAWFQRYTFENYVHIDPVIALTRTTDDAFVWSEAIDYKALSWRARRVMDEATEFGMIDGYSVPLHSATGLQAIVTFGAAKVDLSPDAKRALHLVSIYAHNRLRSIQKAKSGVAATPSVNITPSERECISWCAAGKTDWEIGLITNRSERTVHHLVTSAQRKLNVVNRGQLIAESFRTGILR
ncbi:helix-turn-helix transcriptional regulator [Rhizobium leguminosarum]|uniref:helix-turn-helix transcriptional regulator n=1 Tax=Rhizobium leguminosarum TaxID=384 RepID=UPI001AEB47D5|nr:LuxR family transcriptional regulator [Rhizobium leguminosarum]MBP2444077.1 LuxR family quorum sensing-dependent transcriptional regulator [Rhizobium leguminosarum]